MEYPFKDLLPLDEVLAREGYYKDWTHLDPETFYSITQISEMIKTKGYGTDVRLLISQLAEHFGLSVVEVTDIANELIARQDNVEQFNTQTIQEMTDKDVISAPELIEARKGENKLSTRLDKEYNALTAQLAQKANTLETTNLLNLKADKLEVNANLSVKRDKSDKIKSSELDISNELHKIHLVNLGDDVNQALSGNAPAGVVIDDNSVSETKLAPRAVSREKLADRYSLGNNLPAGTDLKTIAQEGTYTGVPNGSYINTPPGYTGAYAFILEVRPAYKESNIWVFMTFTELIHPFKKWRVLVNLNKTYDYKWVAYHEMARANLVDDFMTNLDYIRANGNFDSADRQGNYMALPGALNAPLTNATFSLVVNNFKTTATGNEWRTQTATTTDGDTRVFVRKKYHTQAYGEWKELTNLPSSVHKFNGKNILCFGDSFTESGDYPQRIASKTGANVTSIGFGGCRMTRYAVDSIYTPMCMSKLSEYIASGDFAELEAAAHELFETNGDDNRPQVARLKATDFSKVDYITIFHGTNDYGGNMPVGSDTDMTYDTFKGAINLVIKNIMTAYPHIKILFISPFWRATYTGVSERVDSDTYPNPLGHYLIEYVDALLERTGANHVPVLDMYRNGGINKYNYEHWLGDGLHPKVGIGYEYVADKILAGFEAVY